MEKESLGLYVFEIQSWSGWLLIISFNKASKTTMESGIICKSNYNLAILYLL